MSLFPEAFVHAIYQTLPKEVGSALLASLNEPVPYSVRMNPLTDAVLKVPHEKLPYSPWGYFLNERPVFTADPAFHAGAYYPQEANSMWIGEVFQFLRSHYYSENTGLTVLDLCAAPGGKSTDIAARMFPGDLLVANEVIAQRNAVLSENLCKWGYANHIITRADAHQLGKAGMLFDIIFADAPCSGEGMFRKDHAAINEWSLNNVNLCTQRQQRIVHDVWDALKPGGFLVYSTCTFNRSENEDNVLTFCKNTGAQLVPFKHLQKTQLYELEPFMYRCLPHLSKGEGLFFAILQKPEGLLVADIPKNKKKSNSNKVSTPNTFTFEGFQSHLKNESTYLLNEEIEHAGSVLSKLPSVVHPGIPAGAFFKGKWKPHAAIGLLKQGEFGLPVVELNNEEVMVYLKREFVSRKTEELGAVIVAWNGHRIGTANALKNGLNNLLPMEWRVRGNFVAHSIVE